MTSNRANIDASLNVLVAARDEGVKRLVYAGSSSAYGDTPTLPESRNDADGSAVAVRAAEARGGTVLPDVHAPLRPRNRDHPLLQCLRPASGSLVTVLRRHLAVHQRAVRGRQPQIYGDGEHTRDFTYVANVVDGVLRACDAKEASGEVINVATGGRISLNQLFRTVRDLTGAKVEPIYAEPRAGDVKDSQADITKARTDPRVRANRHVRRRSRPYRSVVSRITTIPVA